MKKLKRLVMIFSILLITTISAEINYKKEYGKQVNANVKLKNKIIKKDKKIIKLEADKNTEKIMLNLTKDKVKGSIVTIGVLYVSPWCAILYFI